MEVKWCKQCDQNLSIENFYNRYSICKECTKFNAKKRFYAKKGVDIPIPVVKISEPETPVTKTKICTSCNLVKLITDFYKKSSVKRDGLHAQCKECSSKRQRERYNRISDPLTTMRKCWKCNAIKCLADFRKNKANTKYYKICMDCWAPQQWSTEKQRSAEKKYAQNNRDKIIEKYKRQNKNINRRIRHRLNARIRMALSKEYIKKTKNTLTFTGCSREFLKKWFEFQFNENIGWHNMEEWHIDHVKPCISYDLSDEKQQLECFNWRNLRPCLGSENMAKSASIDESLIKLHSDLVLKFLEVNPLPTLSGDSVEGAE